MMTLDEIRRALDTRQHKPAKFKAVSNQASVAMILCDGKDDLEVCFIRRAERVGDPWSGQVAFPGGKADSSDSDAHAVAERETHEEVGLKLKPGHRVGPLPTRQVATRNMVLSPFIYHIGSDEKATVFAREPDEVAHVFWVPMRHLFKQSSATELEYPIGGCGMTFPGIRYEEDVIWGLTLSVLESFAQIMRRELPV
ncbi:MAG: CoA pyrophosphatase [Gammaproteobacteria bacterium]|nr:CoA pyrophosphatase [Gammaproteobacteria bacterium]MBQ0838398.1 CoA pyrophosphatase [Gammaproteobacteria bacterium]